MEKLKGLRALLLDCNGILIDYEPIHLRLFQKVLKEEGIPLTRAEYFKRYLAMDDRGCFREALRRHGRAVPEARTKDPDPPGPTWLPACISAGSGSTPT